MTLTANGTAEKPITFTSEASDSWTGLWFYNFAQTNSIMNYCTIENAGTYSTAAIGFHGTKISITNCKILNAKTVGILSDSDQQGFVSFNKNTISNPGTHAVVLKANTVQTLGTENTITCSTGYGIKIDGGNFSQNTATIWKKMSVPYYCAGIIGIDGQLTIEPGTILKFETNSIFKIGFLQNTTFTANGTASNRITFTSSSAAKTTGTWKGLWFNNQTLNTSKLNFCDISYGGAPGDSTDANIRISGVSNMTISNCDISYSKAWGIYLDNSTLSSASIDNTFTGTNVLGNIRP
jgi:parallel beta-helix repeat protein